MKRFKKFILPSLLGIFMLGAVFAGWKVMNWSTYDVIAKRLRFTSDGTSGGTSVMDINSGGSVIVYGPLVDGSGNNFITGGALSGFITGGSLSGYITGELDPKWNLVSGNYVPWSNIITGTSLSYINVGHGKGLGVNNCSANGGYGYTVTANSDFYIKSLTKKSTASPTSARILLDSGYVLIDSANFSGDVATFSFPVLLTSGTKYILEGYTSGYFCSYYTWNPGYPITMGPMTINNGTTAGGVSSPGMGNILYAEVSTTGNIPSLTYIQANYVSSGGTYYGIMYDLAGNAYSTGAGGLMTGDFLPLSGNTINTPMLGNIYFESGNKETAPYLRGINDSIALYVDGIANPDRNSSIGIDDNSPHIYRQSGLTYREVYMGLSGLTYNDDYSSSYVDRTLVDKGYVDSVAYSGFVNPNSNNTFTGTQTIAGLLGWSALTQNNSVTGDFIINRASGNFQSVVISSGTYSNPLKMTFTGALVGEYTLKLIQGNSSTGMINWNDNTYINFKDGIRPFLSTTTGAVDIIKLFYDGTNWYGYTLYTDML